MVVWEEDRVVADKILTCVHQGRRLREALDTEDVSRRQRLIDDWWGNSIYQDRFRSKPKPLDPHPEHE
jgi:hypothetical protein